MVAHDCLGAKRAQAGQKTSKSPPRRSKGAPNRFTVGAKRSRWPKEDPRSVRDASRELHEPSNEGPCTPLLDVFMSTTVRF
eukprot:2887879-Pyramimonas_sp.AAC.1